jgi:hypothetical protein
MIAKINEELAVFESREEAGLALRDQKPAEAVRS